MVFLKSKPLVTVVTNPFRRKSMFRTSALLNFPTVTQHTAQDQRLRFVSFTDYCRTEPWPSIRLSIIVKQELNMSLYLSVSWELKGFCFSIKTEKLNSNIGGMYTCVRKMPVLNQKLI